MVPVDSPGIHLDQASDASVSFPGEPHQEVRVRTILPVVLALAVLAVSCVREQPADEVAPARPEITTTTIAPAAELEWAAEAVAWTLALDNLPGESGGSAWRYFWAPDIAFDYRSMWPGAPILRGEEAFSFMQRLLPPRSNAATPDGAPFISTDRVVSILELTWEPSGMDTSAITATPAHIVDVLGPIGPDGAQRMVSAFASDSWRERRASPVEADEADAFAARWTTAWSGPDNGVTGLYSTDATLVDSIAGLSLDGVADIAAEAEQLPSASWTVAELDDGTAAVYPITVEDGILDALVLVVDGTDTSGCRHRLAVLLTVADGLIVHEERFWSIGPARRCLPNEDLPGGWWDGRELDLDTPGLTDEDLVTQTGLVQVNGVRIAIYNGTPWLQASVRWALTRFEVAGLPFPSPVEITFTSHSELCDEALGRGRYHDGEWSVFVCFDEDDLCVDEYCSAFATGPKHVLLHELAHVWLRSNLSDDDRDAFTRFVGLTEWSDSDVEWAEQAMEHAAESLAWGLCDRPFTNPQLGNGPEEMRAQFEFLTGREALQPTEPPMERN